MLKCPNNNCCTVFSESDIKSHWRAFQESLCYVCGTQQDWGLDIEKYKPVAVVKPAAPVKSVAPPKKLTKAKTPAKKKKTATKKNK